MERLRELLAQFNDEATRADMSADDLAELLTLLRESADDLLEGDVTDEVLAELDDIAASVESVESEQTERTAAEAERAERAQAVADRIRGAADGDDDGEDADDAVDDASAEDDDATGEDAEDETAPAEGEDETDATAEVDDVGAESEEIAEPIAAAGARSAPYRPRVTRVAARRPQTEMERQRQAAQSQSRTLALTASANVQASGIVAGENVSDPDRLASIVAAAWDNTQGYRGPATKIPVARSGSMRAEDVYGEERTLGRDPRVNADRIGRITGRDAIVAAGGRCVASEISYDLPSVVGSEARPVRDQMLTRFGADRGGVVTRVPFTLQQVSAGSPNAVDVWTENNDANPGSDGPTTKPVQEFACHSDRETEVYAVTKRLKFGNFRARFDPESVQEAVDLVGVWHARTAENELLSALSTGSTAVTSGQLLGATRDVLATLDRAQASLRSVHRMDMSIPLRFGFPFWLYDMIRTDIARALPTGTLDENLALAEASIDRWFAVRNINPTGFLDGEAGQVFGVQGAGPLAGWPSTVVTYLYPEGAWLFLDGGSLDLGIVRDTTTNSTNDFQMFAETFEAAHFNGVDSWKLTMDLCPDGAVSGTVDIDPCSSGS